MAPTSEKDRYRPTLKEAFESTFHSQYPFSDFLSTSIDSETERFIINERPIYKASSKLKKYLRFLNTFVFNYADINTNVVHSYRKGRSPYTAIVPHTKSKYFYKTDIKNFFYSINTNDVDEVLITNLNSIPIRDIKDYKSQILQLITIDGMLPVGLPTSPNITNSILFNFDNKLEEYCQNNELFFTRYSDDIIISSTKKHALQNINEIVELYLNNYSKIKFTINKHKTKFTHIGKKVKLLGMVILPSGEITVDTSIKNDIGAIFHFYLTDKLKYTDLLNKKFDGKKSAVSGKLNYVNTIDPMYLNKLKKKYGNFTVDHFYSGTED